jgi:aminopeptidase N
MQAGCTWLKVRRILLLTGFIFLALAGCRAGERISFSPGASGGGPFANPPTPPVTPSPGVATPTRLPTATPLPPTPIPSPTLTLLSGRASIGDPLMPELGNTGYDVVHYDLQLALDPAEGKVDAIVTIEATTTMPSLRQISLDFVGFDVSFVTVNGEVATYRRERGKLWVEFPRPLLEEGTTFSLTVGYAGQPEQVDSPYIHYANYLGLIFPGNNTFYTLSEPDGARYWFPANDHPLDKATFRTELTVPRGLAAIGNGHLVDSQLSTMPGGGDATTFVWEHNYPMATYLALAAGGHYLRVEDVSPGGVPLVYYYFPELEEEFTEAVDVTSEAIDWLSGLLGPYPFDSYGQASYYAMGVSMEMQTMTLLSYQMLEERAVIHELAHSWFGNWVGLESWSDTWRKEGLATYMELLWLARDDPAVLDELVAEMQEEVAEKGHDYPLNQPPPDRLLSFDSYNRGALLFHALHQEMGDDAFFAGLRLYITRYGGDTASQAEFQAVMEEAAGRSLDTFFAEWLGSGQE